jgi:hypothetical protein
LQQELDETHPGLALQILGLNAIGAEASNAMAVAGNTLPWLQETAEQRVWEPWEVRYRDVVILDAENRPAAVFNLTDHNLAKPAEYDSLRTLLESLAGAR